MPADDLFKRYLEVGASVLGMSRERAESIVRDLVASGEVAKGQATKAADWLVERGRTGTEELAEMIRREIRQQVTAMGLATREDVARLEARLEEVGAATTPQAAPAPPADPATPTGTRAKAAARRKAAAATAPTAATEPPAGAPADPSRSPAPAKKAQAAPRSRSGSGSAGITRSGSVKRAGAPPPARRPARPEG